MRITGRILFCVLMVIGLRALPGPGAAVTGSVDGIVRDSATGQLLSGVKIGLISAKTESLTFKLTTDAKGHFYKSGLVPGIYKMTLEKEGYVPQGGSIQVVLDETARLDLRLEAATGLEAGAPAVAKKIAAGAELITMGKYEEAVSQLSEAIAALPLNAVPYFYRGLAHEKSGKTEEALQDYQRAGELKPDFILPLNRSGMIWAKKGDFDKAGDFYRKALDSGDQDSTTLYNFGVCLMNSGKSADARPVFEKLLAKDPEYADVYFQLGVLSLSAGETARAKELLEKFIAKDPENKNAALAKEILKSLGKEPAADPLAAF
jgi:Tfp pilus assembly protein PilF